MRDPCPPLVRWWTRRLAYVQFWLCSLVLPAFPIMAHAITCGDVLVGGTHTLTADLDCSRVKRFALVVRDGAVLDLNGFTVFSGTLYPGGSIILDGTGATLKNGAVDARGMPVFVGGTGGHRVEQITATGSSFIAFWVVSDQNWITGNSVENALASYIVEGNGNWLMRNDTAVADYAIHIYGQQNVVIRNTTHQQFGGIFVPGDLNLITRNFLEGGGFEGIHVLGQGNTISWNMITGFALDAIDAHGNCTTNRWLKNTLISADPPCIFDTTMAPMPEEHEPPRASSLQSRPRVDLTALCTAARQYDGSGAPVSARCDAIVGVSR